MIERRREGWRYGKREVRGEGKLSNERGKERWGFLRVMVEGKVLVD